MNLNRRIRHRGLSREQIATHGKHASHHAVEILCLAQRLISQHGSTMKDYAFVSRGSFTIPALCEAIDVVTAVGRVVDILEPRSQIMSLMYSTLDLLDSSSTSAYDGEPSTQGIHRSRNGCKSSSGPHKLLCTGGDHSSAVPAQ